jgi:GH24 family phage-related lysozyme (muramidase)
VSQPRSYAKPGATVGAALLVSLLWWESSGKYMNTPQPVIENKTDSQWCAGITGIPKQDYYTNEECDRYTAGHLHSDMRALERCMPLADMPQRIQFAAQHLAYNTGPALVCKSTMARHWRAGDYSPASCAAILRYTFVAGKDCRKTGNRCPGIPKRRDYEYGACTGAIDWREQAWNY